MPRQPRIDAPGTLHHVMGRGIETSRIFKTGKDREDFIDRLAELCRSGRWAIYAWALLPSHFHLLVRTGKEPQAREIAVDQGITETELRAGSRRRKVSEARRGFCRASLGELGFPAAAVARFLGVTTSAVVRAARAE